MKNRSERPDPPSMDELMACRDKYYQSFRDAAIRRKKNEIIPASSHQSNSGESVKNNPYALWKKRHI